MDIHYPAILKPTVVELRQKPCYTLAELLSQCTDENMALTADDRAWLDLPPVGKELLD